MRKLKFSMNFMATLTVERARDQRTVPVKITLLTLYINKKYLKHCYYSFLAGEIQIPCISCSAHTF